MFTYGFIPFSIMLICSFIIIYKLYSSKRTNMLNDKKTKNEYFLKNFKSMRQMNSISRHISFKSKRNIRCERNSMSKQLQVTSILLTTNFLFISLISPLLVLNVLDMLQDNTLRTTIVYFLCYANHG